MMAHGLGADGVSAGEALASHRVGRNRTQKTFGEAFGAATGVRAQRGSIRRRMANDDL